MNRHLEHDWYREPLPDNVHLGQRTWLYSSYAFRHFRSRQVRGLFVGNDTGLYNGTFFDVAVNGTVEIGNFCTIVGAIICTNTRVVIQDFVFIAHEVVIADQAVAVPDWESDPHSRWGANSVDSGKANQEGILIGENAWIASRAILLGGTRIGEGSIVGAGAVIDFEVPPFCIAAGNPARIVGKVRRCR